MYVPLYLLWNKPTCYLNTMPFVFITRQRPRYLLHKKYKGAKIVTFFIFNLDFSCLQITLHHKLKFVPHGTPQEKNDLQCFSPSRLRPEQSLKSVLAVSLPFTSNGHFSIPLEWYQSKLGGREAGSLVNSAVNAIFSRVQRYSLSPMIKYSFRVRVRVHV